MLCVRDDYSIYESFMVLDVTRDTFQSMKLMRHSERKKPRHFEASMPSQDAILSLHLPPKESKVHGKFGTSSENLLTCSK